ncbi:hypothetical protein ACUXQ2_003578 [Cupriavidus metallidurans]
MSSLAATIGRDDVKCTMWYINIENWGLRENVGMESGWRVDLDSAYRCVVLLEPKSILVRFLTRGGKADQ